MPYSQEQLQQLGQINDLINSDPEAREALQRHLVRVGKTRNLNFNFPDLQAKDAAKSAASEVIKPYEEKISELEKKMLERDALDALAAKRDSIKALGASPAEIEAVERLMVDKGMYFENYAEALEYYRYKNKPLTPSGRENSFTRRFPGIEDPKEHVLKDPEMMKPKSKKLKEYLDAEYDKAFKEATAQTGGKLAFW
jgi:hypothetical protein